MLLSRGADPNMVVMGEGANLRPVLPEYLSANTHISPNVLRLLLKYGARVSQLNLSTALKLFVYTYLNKATYIQYTLREWGKV